MFQQKFGSSIKDILGTKDKTQEEEYLISEEKIIDEIEYENKPIFHNASINTLSTENDAQVW